jgi:hypothetical protein
MEDAAIPRALAEYQQTSHAKLKILLMRKEQFEFSAENRGSSVGDSVSMVACRH